MTTFSTYVLLQIPGWVLMAFLLAVLQEWLGFSIWVAAGIFVVWVVKDFLLYPFVRSALRPDAKTGSEELVGVQGIALDRLEPRGYVRVRGELWQAEVESGHESILPGSAIRVQSAQKFTLIVKMDQGIRPYVQESFKKDEPKGSKS